MPRDARACNPYDEVPYRSVPIEWSAPERIALASLLHGGPRPALDGARVIELGCGDGSNLVPLACYRPRQQFIGVDGCLDALHRAEARSKELGLSNLTFIHADLLAFEEQVDGSFDFILSHGVFSWIPDAARDALLDFCGKRLRPRGLVYLNYNARPGWDVRGMVRRMFVEQTAEIEGLAARSLAARSLASRIAATLQPATDDPYAQLMERELRFVAESDPSYVAHEYLAEHNRAYWRSEFLGLASRYGLGFVADADFNYHSGRVTRDRGVALSEAGVRSESIADLCDLLSYRQLHSPILTASDAWQPALPTDEEFGSLFLASCMAASSSEMSRLPVTFRHPNGAEVEVREEPLASAFMRLAPLWPRAVRVSEMLEKPGELREDIELLHRYGLIELRLVESPLPECSRLHDLEGRAGYRSNTYHHVVSEAAPCGS